MAETEDFFDKVMQSGRFDGSILDDYLRAGWFRKKDRIFTTSHLINMEELTLNRVWWLRYPVKEVQYRESHRKIFRKNRSFQVVHCSHYIPDAGDQELYRLYGDQVPFEPYENLMNALFYEELVPVFDTHAFRIYDQDRLIGLGIFDMGEHAAASIVHCYDPEYKKYSLGKYLILLTVEYLKVNKGEFYYPGYLIAGRPSFNYKLFLGTSTAQIYYPFIDEWKPFTEDILINRTYTMTEFADFFLV